MGDVNTSIQIMIYKNNDTNNNISVISVSIK